MYLIVGFTSVRWRITAPMAEVFSTSAPLKLNRKISPWRANGVKVQSNKYLYWKMGKLKWKSKFYRIPKVNLPSIFLIKFRKNHYIIKALSKRYLPMITPNCPKSWQAKGVYTCPMVITTRDKFAMVKCMIWLNGLSTILIKQKLDILGRIGMDWDLDKVG